jgi:hypothetical protein
MRFGRRASVQRGPSTGAVREPIWQTGADNDERVLALLSVLEFTIAVVECRGCRKQMIKAPRRAIPEMLRNIPKLVAELATEDNEAPDHVHWTPVSWWICCCWLRQGTSTSFVYGCTEPISREPE